MYRDRAIGWFNKFDFGFDINERSTWIKEHLPVMTNSGMITGYCATHEAWLWGTDELLVSFDAVNITLPSRKDVGWTPWPHIDQSPTRKGLGCGQGIINLSESGPLDEEVKWFEDYGCTLVKVEAEPGDLIIWDLRTVHCASLPKSETIQTIIYVTYTPAKLATPEDLALKASISHRYESTTHWPHCNIFARGNAMRGDEICPGEREEPLKPELGSGPEIARSAPLLRKGFASTSPLTSTQAAR
ncbi:hypothetical protein BDV33DRAFT_189086 [Aspergillus novoparasiticus]|uniref:Phytanoyl-CoA dioxygenase n=1 Tax=Aspergillus novoparasiticus TaxID=986946 RepID=A0A5N6F119_9EURO|nr:hypothetical protein BDV33DRAFT_189086 [Aspergillus novoparasiticus]